MTRLRRAAKTKPSVTSRLATGEVVEERLKDVENNDLIIDSAGLRLKVKRGDEKLVALRRGQAYEGLSLRLKRHGLGAPCSP